VISGEGIKIDQFVIHQPSLSAESGVFYDNLPTNSLTPERGLDDGLKQASKETSNLDYEERACEMMMIEKEEEGLVTPITERVEDMGKVEMSRGNICHDLSNFGLTMEGNQID
jgi:hypothetical protein